MVPVTITSVPVQSAKHAFVFGMHAGLVTTLPSVAINLPCLVNKVSYATDAVPGLVCKVGTGIECRGGKALIINSIVQG